MVPEGGRGGLRPAGPVGFFKPKQAKEEPKRRELTGGTFIEARPQRLDLTGIPKHPASIVEPASMASVSPPPITYEGKIPASLATSGDLSDLQLEAVLYAGQRHAQTLPGGQRAGFLIGDGPGVGKTRELASITLDNWNQGRKRTLWLSVGWNLVSGVRDGLNQVGAEEIPLHRLDSIERGDPAAFGDGVLFATYSTFREPERIAQVQEWLGEDPLIHFDEAHKAKNLVSELGEPTKTGAAVLKIQNENPTARVTYASATAATEPRNMGYMVRLGLWGPGTPFAKFNDFQTAIETGGVGAMEMISRDVKALGIGTSRGISMEGVEFRETVHNLTQDQKDVYNRSAKLWQEVLKRIDEAIAVTGGKSFARSRALSQFYGAMQRFFKAVATSSKVPTLIKRMEEELKEGRSVVVRLVSTAEGRTEDQVAKAKAEGTDLDDLDITPRETITGYIENSFPTTLYQDYTDPDTGQTMTRPVLDSSGEPVQDPEAVAMRDELLRMVSDLRLPEHPLDQMLKHFGADKVAEVTGRNKRLIVNKVTGKREWASRNPKSANAAERDAFQGGKKRILLLNDSGGTGMDAHADNKAKNKQQRVYFIFETGWSADNELQALGRVNRTNQASAPIYDLVSTDLSGERRFYSTIAKRLEQLGALSRGDRSGVSAGGLADFNFENDYGKGAARAVYDDLEYEDSETLLQMGFIDPKTGRVRIQNADKTDVPKFLNRVLALEVDKQAEVFGKFEQAFSAIVQKAKDEDRYDTGVSDLKAERVTVVGKPTVVSTDPTSGATTEHVELSAEYKTHPMTWTMAQGWANKEGSAYYTNARSGRVSLAVKSANITNNETGRIEQFYRLFKPNGSVESIPETELRERYDRVSEPKALWDAEYAETPKTRKESVHLITGVTLPIWDKLGTRSQVLKVVRTDTEGGKRFVGVKIPTKEVGKVLRALNVRTVTADPAQVFQSVNGGASIDLDRGLRLSRVRIRGDQRIEIAGKDIASRGKELVGLGALEERIDFKFRYFVPDDDVRGVKVLASILKAYPVVETSEAKFSAKPKPAPDTLSAPPVDIAAVRREFPRAEVRELGPGTFEVKDGLRTIHVRVDDEGLAGTVDRGAFRAAYGRDFDPSNDAVVGAWVQVPRGGVMWLAKTADSSVLRHERFHYEKGKAPGTESFPARIARAFGFGSRIALTDEERAALYKKFEPQAKMDQERRSVGSWDRLSATEREKVVEEYQAEAYAHWRPEEKPNSLFSKILEAARRFWRAFRPSWESAFERVSRGDTSEGRNGGGDDQARFSAVNRKSDGFVQAEDQYGRYRTLNGAVDVNGNWKRFQELPPDERVLLYHATSRANADAILRDGYDGTNATWGDNPKDYVYMGGKESLGTYSGRHRDAVMVLFEVRRGDVEPDKGTDWKSFLRIPANREFAKRHHGNVSDPSAVETFGLINQVRAHRSTVRAVAVVKDGEIIAKNPDIRYSIAARSESPAKPASPDTDKPSKPLDTGRPLRTGPMDADELTRRVIDASNGTGTPAGTPIEQLAPPEFHRNFSVVLKSGVPKDEAERFARIYAAFDKENNVARGKMSWDQGDKEALKLLGLHTREQFMDALKRGVTFNEPGLRAATRIMHEVREEHESAMATLNAAREAGGGKIDSDEYRAVAATSANLAAWTLALRGEQAEAARAFNARKDLRAGRTDSEKLLGRIFKNIGGLTDKQAEAILRTAELEPKKLPDAIRRAMKPGFWDYVNEWRKGGLLWSPRTFLGVNPFGNALKQAITLLEIPVGAAIDRARGGADSERQVRAGELAAAMAGLADYGPAALKQLRADVWNAMKGVEEFDVNKSRPFEHQVGVIPGPLGKLIRTPFRFLQAADDFFKETAKAQSLYREAFRRARNEGLTGQNATRRAEELIGIGKGSDWQDKRVAGMIDKANRMAMYETFTLPTNYENAGIFGSLASAVQQVERRRGISGAVGLFAPFKSTPAHIAYQSFERSPFGLFLVYNRIKELDSLRKSLDTAKGMQKEDILKDIEAKTQEMVEQMARAVIGSALFGVAASMAALGLLTGSGPADWEDRKVWMDAGNIPTGIKVGDSDWYAYDRFEPAAASIAIAANFPDILKERSFGGQAAAFMNAMQDAWVSKTYLQGLEQFGDVITDPKRYSEKWLRDLVGSFVPAAVAQTAEVLDPTVREKTGSLLDGFRSRVPGLSDDLPASRTGTGEPAKRTGRLGGGSPLNPLGFIRTGSADGDPLAKEFLDADYSPTPPRKTIVIGVGPKGYKRRHEVALLPAELEAFRKADERVTRRLRRLIETDRWQDLDPYVKKQTLQRVYDAAANAVRELVLPRAARRLKQQLSGRSV